MQMRESAIIGGLKIRCKALVECGWKWTEVGKAGLMVLDASSSRGSIGELCYLHKLIWSSICFQLWFIS